MTTVLFTRKDSIYKELGCDCWDAERNARLYLGAGPVIAHPPCRAWGRMAHWSKHTDYEKSHAVWTIDLIRKFGGIMEHPVTSRVWELLDDDEKTLVVDQNWFGHPAQKRTRLFYNLPNRYPPIPFQLERIERPVEQMSKRQREQTPRPFAEWLIKWINSK